MLGQKIHPLGLRLNLTQNYRSIWYVKFNNYKILLQEDYIIRNFIEKLGKTSDISNILINRNGIGNFVYLNIETEQPKFFIQFGIKKLIKNIKKLLPYNRQILVNITEITNKNMGASSLANSIVNNLKNRIAFKRIVRMTFQKAEEISFKGIKIQISGRLNGSDIARSEWFQKGKLPLHTLKIPIDYSEKQAKTIYGIIGVKVWLFKNK